ncbi:acyltransferase [Empedobacter falsenii]|uniref:acyltransferase n=1 Tax=Empedobacter falsenii TaxID=343874 RepID=UPI0025753FA9|nr:acyltransferase [Empedobacter falsenii]MDM1062249.1 acyltransferase [Empedobacter falsenii]
MFYKILLFLDKLIEKAKREQAYKLFKQNSNSKIASDFKLGNNYYYDISPKAIIEIEDKVTMNESNYLTIKSDAKFFVGKNTYITRATISCLGEITIGENCILGEGMKLFDHNHQYTKEPFSVSKTDFNIGFIKIGNNVWTGANVVILKDVTIGDNVIIGAGCVIHKDVPSNSIIVNKQEHKIISNE